MLSEQDSIFSFGFNNLGVKISMANITGTHMIEGQSITRPPHFSGSNYNYWKVRMRITIMHVGILLKMGLLYPQQ